MGLAGHAFLYANQWLEVVCLPGFKAGVDGVEHGDLVKAGGQGSSNLQDNGPNCYFGPMDCHFAHLGNVAKDVPEASRAAPCVMPCCRSLRERFELRREKQEGFLK